MSLCRNLLAFLFWGLAALCAWPAIQQLMPIASDWIGQFRGAEPTAAIVDAAQLYSSLQSQVPWLVLAGVLIANATLVRMLNAMNKI